MWVAAMHTSLHSWTHRILRSDKRTAFSMNGSVASETCRTAELQNFVTLVVRKWREFGYPACEVFF
jgi:hypothetical protein